MMPIISSSKEQQAPRAAQWVVSDSGAASPQKDIFRSRSHLCHEAPVRQLRRCRSRPKVPKPVVRRKRRRRGDGLLGGRKHCRSEAVPPGVFPVRLLGRRRRPWKSSEPACGGVVRQIGGGRRIPSSSSNNPGGRRCGGPETAPVVRCPSGLRSGCGCLLLWRRDKRRERVRRKVRSVRRVVASAPTIASSVVESTAAAWRCFLTSGLPSPPKAPKASSAGASPKPPPLKASGAASAAGMAAGAAPSKPPKDVSAAAVACGSCDVRSRRRKRGSVAAL